MVIEITSLATRTASTIEIKIVKLKSAPKKADETVAPPVMPVVAASQPIYTGPIDPISRNRVSNERSRHRITVFRRAVIRDASIRTARLAHPRVAA